MTKITPNLTNISHLLLNAGASYKLDTDEWFVPDSLYPRFAKFLNEADSKGRYYPNVLTGGCDKCGSNLHLIRHLDVRGKDFYYFYFCLGGKGCNMVPVNDFRSIFATKKKHSLYFDEVDLGTRYHHLYCKKCRLSKRMHRTYFGFNSWLVCENSEDCGTFFVETEQNRKKYTSTHLTDAEILKLSLAKPSIPPPSDLIWDGFESFHLSALSGKYQLEQLELLSAIYDCKYKFAENLGSSDDTNFLLLALYFSNMNVAAAIKLGVCKATYRKREQSIFEICRKSGGAEFLISTLRERCEQINNYRALFKRAT